MVRKLKKHKLRNAFLKGVYLVGYFRGRTKKRK